MKCAVHHHWLPVPTESYYVWPLEYGGSATPSNTIRVCEDGGYEIQICLELMRTGITLFTDTFNRKVRAYAGQGFAQIELANKKKVRPPNPLRPGTP